MKPGKFSNIKPQAAAKRNDRPERNDQIRLFAGCPLIKDYDK